MKSTKLNKIKRTKLKLFVWENVLNDHTPGIMFALAKDVESARKQILKKENREDVKLDLMNQPLVITKPQGFALYGGG